MPIKHLTDRGLAFPQIGVIRKGSPKQKRQNPDGSEYSIQGKDLKFFRVLFDEAETQAQKAFVEKYGNEPVFMNATFPFNEIDRVWSAWLEAYTSNRLIARSDGEEVPPPAPQAPEPAKAEAKAEPKYAWNSDKIIHAVKKITSYSNQEAAATMSEATKKGLVAKELTLTEAEAFARALVTPVKE